VLVSHDMHLLSLAADRLWLVKGGRVEPFEDDLEAYRKLLLAADETPKREAPRAAPKPVSRDARLALRAELRRCEDRVAKLEEMRAKIDARLADPALYAPGKGEEIAAWQKKHAEVIEGLERAEGLWIEAQERLDAAGG
jgi:ATP-binding cassette subfamily F protein 3